MNSRQSSVFRPLLLVLGGMILGAVCVLILIRPGPNPGGPESENAVGEGVPNAQPRMEVKLYFADREENRLVAETGYIPPAVSVQQRIQFLVNELLRGSKNLVSVIPQNTELRNVLLDSKETVYLSFSGDIQKNHPGGVWTELLTIYSLVDTVIENNPEVKRVKLLVEEKEVETLAGHVSTLRPFGFNAQLISGSKEIPREETPTETRPELGEGQVENGEQ